MSADAFAEGHDLVAATVLVRGPGDDEWAAAPMLPLGNDRFEGTFEPDREGRWTFTIRAWVDRFGSWRRDLTRRVEAGRTSRSTSRSGPRSCATPPAAPSRSTPRS